MQDIPYDVSHVPIDYDDYVNVKEVSIKISRKDERRERREQRAALEKDVAQLQKKLMIEVNMRNALHRGLNRPLGSLPRIHGNLPIETRELLLEVAVLEEEIISLQKQVIQLGREIENEVPATDKEAICQPSNQMSSPEKAEILVSPSVSPKDSARINSMHSISPRKSNDQRSKLSKVSFPAGKVTENNSSPSKISISPRNSLDNDNAKSSVSPKDSSEPRRITTIVPPQKSPVQRNSLHPKVSVRNSRDLKSRRLSFTKKEPYEATLSSVMQTVPFIPMKLSLPKDDETSTPPVSPAPVISPSDAGKSCSKPPRIKSANGKPPMTAPARSRSKDPVNNKVAPPARTLKTPSTPRPPGQDKGSVDQAMHTPRLPRQPVTHGTILTRRTLRPSTATLEQRMNTQKTSSAPDARINAPLSCDSSPQIACQKPVDAGPAVDVPVDAEPVDAKTVDSEAGRYNTNNADIPSTGELDGDYKPIHPLPDHAKASEPTCSPERDSKLGLKQVTDSVLLSEEVVKLLETIYGNLQEKQVPLASDSGSSSQASTSTRLSSASPDEYEMRGGGNIKFRLDDCHTGSFRTKRGATSMKFLRDCYSGEVADALDPYTCLSRGNISKRTDFHQRVMS